MSCSSLISSTIRRQVVGKQVLPRIIISAASQSTVSYQNDIPYEKPHNVEQWERLATKELSKSSKSVDSLRTERVTPVSTNMFLFAIQRVLIYTCRYVLLIPSTSYYYRKG